MDGCCLLLVSRVGEQQTTRHVADPSGGQTRSRGQAAEAASRSEIRSAAVPSQRCPPPPRPATSRDRRGCLFKFVGVRARGEQEAECERAVEQRDRGTERATKSETRQRAASSDVVESVPLARRTLPSLTAAHHSRNFDPFIIACAGLLTLHCLLLFDSPCLLPSADDPCRLPFRPPSSSHPRAPFPLLSLAARPLAPPRLASSRCECPRRWRRA